jgi:hypothetical protein
MSFGLHLELHETGFGIEDDGRDILTIWGKAGS